MGAGTSAEEFFLKSINVESIFEFVERTDYLFLYSIKECVEKSDCHEGVYLSEVAEYMKLSIPETSKMVKRDRKSTRLNSSHVSESRMPSSA